MNFLLILTVLLVFASQAAAQCGPSQHPNCASWIKNGFCGNPGYTLAIKQAYCGVLCGVCGPDPPAAG